jgi:EAL and modified HD-GYP domain-containing signal transduction protein
MCESLGASLGTIASGHLFLVGLFSRLGASLGVPLPQLLPRIALPELSSAALLEHRGPYGRVLAAVQAYEAADWDALEAAESGRDKGCCSPTIRQSAGLMR